MAFVTWAEMAQNILRQFSTNLSPFQCVLGYQPVLAPWHQSQTEAPAVDDWFRRAEETWDAAHVQLQRAVLHQKASADSHLRTGSGSRPKTCPSACPAGSWSPVYGAI